MSRLIKLLLPVCLSKIALENNKFVVCSENLTDKGAAASYGIDYYQLGKLTAKQAVEILENRNIPQNMPIKYLEDTKLTLNEDIIKKLNLKFFE